MPSTTAWAARKSSGSRSTLAKINSSNCWRNIIPLTLRKEPALPICPHGFTARSNASLRYSTPRTGLCKCGLMAKRLSLVSYPENFSFQTPTYGALSDQIVQLTPDTNKYPGTNYDDSAITVSAGFAKDASQCLVTPNDNKPLTQTQIINGQVFYVGRATGAGAGNLYSSTIYRILRQTWCTEISLTIHTGNIANYPEGTVSEVDQSKPKADLLQILSTFKFTD